MGRGGQDIGGVLMSGREGDTDALDHGMRVSASASVDPQAYAAAGAAVVGPGNARAFDRRENYYLSATHSVTGATFSLAIWLKTTDASYGKSIFGLYNHNETEDGMYEMIMNFGDILRGILEQDNGLGTSIDFEGTSLADGEWHLVCFAVDSSQMSLWLDGTADGDNPQAHSRTFPSITRVGVGARIGANPVLRNAWEGSLDEASLWEGHYLTDDEVSSLWSIGNDSTKQYLDSFSDEGITTPTHHWKLSESAGDPGADYIGSLDLTDNGTADTTGIPAGD